MNMQTATFPTSPQWLAIALSETKPRHWLLDTVFGRELLKDRLRQLAPTLHLPKFADGYEYDAVLELLVDDLDVRGWQRPSTLKEQFVYLRNVTRLGRQIHCDDAE
jgi:hypothetical protein